MKISDLSQRSGVPLPTIKFYIREGLLPAGERTGRNQAEYSDEHLERLSLIRALKDDAGVTLAAMGRAFSALNDSPDAVQTVIGAIGRGTPPIEASPEERAAAMREVLRLCKGEGWAATADSGAMNDAVNALVVIRRSFPEEPFDSLTLYAHVASLLAQHEIPDDWQPEKAPNAALRYAVLGTLLFEPFILALRRMAHVARATALMQAEPCAPVPDKKSVKPAKPRKPKR